MSTETLISRLAAEPTGRRFQPRVVALSVLGAALAVSSLFLALAGVRPNAASAFAQPVILMKPVLPAILSGVALVAMLRLARPEGRGDARLWLLAIPVTVALLLWGQAFLTRPPERRFAEVSPFSLSECLGLITLLSILPVGIGLALLRRGASTSPGLSGALAGLAGSASAATGYSLFCTQDNPLFYVTWYGFAILVMTLAGALIGSRALRW